VQEEKHMGAGRNCQWSVGASPMGAQYGSKASDAVLIVVCWLHIIFLTCYE